MTDPDTRPPAPPPTTSPACKRIVGHVSGGGMADRDAENESYRHLGHVTIHATEDQIAGLRIGSPAVVEVQQDAPTVRPRNPGHDPRKGDVLRWPTDDGRHVVVLVTGTRQIDPEEEDVLVDWIEVYPNGYPEAEFAPLDLWREAARASGALVLFVSEDGAGEADRRQQPLFEADRGDG